ncbi:catechol 2,3-dioxygenase-like lactoylglutathione lyase family enzyme [Clostridium beijerinckii]|uniref:VOC family protein n=1 Tax=Clostridium beijerinckii TaxID=1520 RepID=UPI00156D5F75|nr:VOC family protein [Clostridium beijerinckii]NRT35141.1 catechol 2,3-dioxygenase-like lactoylglutathione lyase family enzyme [Clostridium beijerinckii]NRT45429.1 catechol 2,3-dioxygenase-like lactoylglutathione lyase family enzyme [Clostridium beijerinckii]NRZ20573.1 catechol 2,3-dioxygenase-like lactoylglutathione lyase family enzyme [Clostridium beijerinckii]
MIEGLSHITFTVRNVEKTAELFNKIFNAEEVYYNGERKHSLFKERFFMIGGQFISVIQDRNTINRTYHHVAFKISNSDVESYLEKIKDLDLELKTSMKRSIDEEYSIYFYDYDNNLFELHTETLKKKIGII